MGYLYRCADSQCRQRKALPRKIEQYVRAPRCASCGGTRFYLDHRQMKANREVCRCDGRHFPHRAGSKWCVHYQGGYSDEELADRYPQYSRG